MTEHDNQIPTPEFGTQPEHLQAVLHLVGDLQDHNDSYTWAGIVLRATGIAPEECDPSQLELCMEMFTAWREEPGRGSLQELQGIDRAILGTTHAETLAGTGLDLGPVNPRQTIETALHGHEEIGSVRLAVADGGTFMHFLKNVTQEPVTHEMRATLEDIIRDSLVELGDVLLETDDQTRIAEIAPYALSIAAILEHLESDENTLQEILLGCSEHTQKGSAREWIIANRIHFFDVADEAEQVGPSYWHAQLTPGDMMTSWSVVMDLIIQLKGKPSAQDFYAKLVKDAWEHLEFSERDWRNGRSLMEDDRNSEYEYAFMQLRSYLKELCE